MHTPTPDEIHEAIKTIIDNVGHALSINKTLTDTEKLTEWVEILKWGLETLPARQFEHTRWHLRRGIKYPSLDDFIPKNSEQG